MRDNYQWLGVIISLTASFVDALGLNLQRRDHLKESKAIKPRHDCLRPLWHLGLYLYVGSQVIGTSLVLEFLKPQLAAPLSTVSLVFNFILARYLVGTFITRRDILGTLIVLVSVLIVILSDVMSSLSRNNTIEEISIETHKQNFRTTQFIVYFSFLNIFVFILLAVALYFKWLIQNPLRYDTSIFKKMDLRNTSKLTGVLIASIGGIIASQTLLLASSGLLLIKSILSGEFVFDGPLPFFIIFLLLFTAVLQIYCLNSGLKLTESILVVPVFACMYNVFTLSNSLFYFDSFKSHPWWFYLTSTGGIVFLSSGIFILAYQNKPFPSSVPQLWSINPRPKSNYESIEISSSTETVSLCSIK